MCIWQNDFLMVKIDFDVDDETRLGQLRRLRMGR